MPLIEVNFDDVPDEVLPVGSGTYTCMITAVEGPVPTKSGTGTKIVVSMKIDSPGSPEHDRLLWDHISLKMETRIKRLFMSAGVPVGSGGGNTDDLLNQHVQVRVKANAYVDDAGVTKQTSNIDDYLVEAED